MKLQQKVKLHYSGAVLIILAISATFYLGARGVNTSDKMQVEYVKSIAYLINLVGIPFSFGWLGLLERAKIKEPWNFRFWFLLSLTIFNCGLYYYATEQSLFFVLLISTGMFLLNKPRKEPEISQENEA